MTAIIKTPNLIHVLVCDVHALANCSPTRFKDIGSLVVEGLIG